MNPQILTDPAAVLDCIESTVRNRAIDGIFNRTSTGFSFPIECAVPPALIVRAEVHRWCFTISTTVPHVPVIDREACLAAARIISALGQLFTVSVEPDSGLFGLNVSVPLGNGACLDSQVVTALCVCYTTTTHLYPLLLRYGRGEIGLQRLVINCEMPGIGFDEPDSSIPSPTNFPLMSTGERSRFGDLREPLN